MPRDYVFITHIRKDKSIVSIVRKAFTGKAGLRPFFLEKKMTSQTSYDEIIEKMNTCKAMFAFLTRNSTTGETRDWVIFEIGTAVGFGRDVYGWKSQQLPGRKVPRVAEHVTRINDFKIKTAKNKRSLKVDVERAIRAVLAKMKKETERRTALRPLSKSHISWRTTN